MSGVEGRIGLMTRRSSQEDVERLFHRNGLVLEEIYVNSFSPLRCTCLKCGRETFARADKVKSKGHTCNFCTGLKGKKVRAEEFVRSLGHIPLVPYPGAAKPWKMKCGECKNEISPRFNSLQSGKSGCSNCGHSRAGERKRRENSVSAVRDMKARHLKPLVEFPGANKPWKSECLKCGEVTSPRLSGLRQGQGGCKTCGIKSSAKSRMLTQSQANAIAKKKKLVPLEPYAGANKKWKCKCLRCGKVSSPYFANIRDGVYGCGWCAKKLVDPEEARKRMVKAGLEPLVAYPGSDVGWLCRCTECKRDVSPTYGSIRAGQGGCKWCKSRNPWVDSSEAIEKLIDNQLQPLEPFKNSHAKWKSRCLRCERIVHPSYHDVKQGSGGCKYCAPNFVNEERILKVMKKAGLIPLDKYESSRKPWKVQHENCGRTFFVEYANIRSGSSCRYCAGVAVIPKEAVRLFKQRGLTPLTRYPGGKKPWKSRCNVCKKVVFPQYTTVATRNSGCVYCAGVKVDPKDAVTFMKMNDLVPLVKYPGARKPWKCRCTVCNNKVSPQYSSVKSGQGGCRFCADWGIDYAAEGFFYLMTHTRFGAHKVGIGNSARVKGDRVKEHKRSGWTLVNTVSFQITDDAFRLEQEILSWLRGDLGLPPFLSEIEMPQGGYTETVDASEIDLSTIWERVLHFSKVKKC